MMIFRLRSLSAVLCLLTACASDPADPPDAGRDSGADVGPSDLGIIDAEPQDQGPADTGLFDSGHDAGADAAVDAGDAGPIAAELDQRCPLDEQIGLLEIATYGAGPQRELRMVLYEAPLPWYGAPALTDPSCDHHVAPNGCGTCQGEEVCSVSGACVLLPAGADGISVRLEGNGTTQTISGGGGAINESITLVEDALSLRVEAPTFVVTLPATAIPPELASLDGTLGGSYEAPTNLEVTWEVTAIPGDVHTRVPINHHVGGPTFTECVVPGSSGALHIDGPMLVPLAVVTGLEFQGIEHVRFARALVPGGCFEIRFARQLYVDLF